ncbi:hypothetical protein SO694_00005561 [Aureococcus anophagefferens]|uniref:Myosin motor domain-containing protein n=3 Tax=Aureococcus anophagefferens TaxID=44056 RepID=A0ABR1G9X8_AURAN
MADDAPAALADVVIDAVGPDAATHALEERVWVPCKRDVWRLATALVRPGEELEIEVAGLDGNPQRFRRKDVRDFDPSHLVPVDDLMRVNNLSEAPLLDALARRHAADAIYTAVGPVLLSVNPYKAIPGLYELPPAEDVAAALELPDDAGAPHVFDVARRALKRLLATGGGQSVVVSGESGAGKTEASKLASGPDLVAQLYGSNVVLEAFGNAKTLRNNNSSRFGKYIRLLYGTGSRRIAAATTETFLLEKSRLARVRPGERGYHAFYELLASGTRDWLAEDPAAYATLAGGAATVDGVDDGADFGALESALGDVAVSAERPAIWDLLGALLALGTVEPDDADENARVAFSGPSRAALELAAEKLGVDGSALEAAVAVRASTSGRGSITEVNLNGHEVRGNLLAAVKHAYGRLFDWVVSRVNRAHGAAEGGAAAFIGILDIFGFEIFEDNSLEQLCINYTNEVLQKQFNEHVFVRERELYAREGLECGSVSFADNGGVLDLIGAKKASLLALLEEQTLLSSKRSVDGAQLASVFHRALGGNPAYAKCRFGAAGFVVKHFAGDVSYVADEFIAKNSDPLSPELEFALGGAAPGGLVAALFPRAGGGGGHRGFAAASSVSSKFRKQLGALRVALDATEPHYVKTIKPNGAFAADCASRPMIAEQLMYSGTLEAVRIRRSGYPVRLPFDRLLSDYAELAGRDGDDRSRCLGLCGRHLDAGQFAVGTSLLFLRDGATDALRDAVAAYYAKRAVSLQNCYRAYASRFRLRRLREDRDLRLRRARLRSQLAKAARTPTFRARRAAVEAALADAADVLGGDVDVVLEAKAALVAISLRLDATAAVEAAAADAKKGAEATRAYEDRADAVEKAVEAGAAAGGPLVAGDDDDGLPAALEQAAAVAAELRELAAAQARALQALRAALADARPSAPDLWTKATVAALDAALAGAAERVAADAPEVYAATTRRKLVAGVVAASDAFKAALREARAALDAGPDMDAAARQDALDGLRCASNTAGDAGLVIDDEGVSEALARAIGSRKTAAAALARAIADARERPGAAAADAVAASLRAALATPSLSSGLPRPVAEALQVLKDRAAAVAELAGCETIDELRAGLERARAARRRGRWPRTNACGARLRRGARVAAARAASRPRRPSPSTRRRSTKRRPRASGGDADAARAAARRATSSPGPRARPPRPRRCPRRRRASRRRSSATAPSTPTRRSPRALEGAPPRPRPGVDAGDREAAGTALAAAEGAVAAARDAVAQLAAAARPAARRATRRSTRAAAGVCAAAPARAAAAARDLIVARDAAAADAAAALAAETAARATTARLEDAAAFAAATEALAAAAEARQRAAIRAEGVGGAPGGDDVAEAAAALVARGARRGGGRGRRGRAPGGRRRADDGEAPRRGHRRRRGGPRARGRRVAARGGRELRAAQRDAAPSLEGGRRARAGGAAQGATVAGATAAAAAVADLERVVEATREVLRTVGEDAVVESALLADAAALAEELEAEAAARATAAFRLAAALDALAASLRSGDATVADPAPAAYSVRACKEVIRSGGLSYGDCFEKRDLLARSLEARKVLKVERETSRAADAARLFRASREALAALRGVLAAVAPGILGADVPVVLRAEEAAARARASRAATAARRLRCYVRSLALNSLLAKAKVEARRLVDDGAPRALEAYLASLGEQAPTLAKLADVRFGGADRYGGLLHVACRSGSAACVAPLAKRLGPRFDAATYVNGDGNTALHSLLGLYAAVGDGDFVAASPNAAPDAAPAPKAGVVCEGPLEKRRETDRWLRRWVKLTAAPSLEYYGGKPKKGATPSFSVPLARAMAKRSRTDLFYDEVPFGFEIHSPDLLKGKNREGRLFFKAESEADLQAWLLGLSTRVDAAGRRELASAANAHGSTALHLLCKSSATAPPAARRRARTGHEAVERGLRRDDARVFFAVLLVECGAPVDPLDLNKATPLELACAGGQVDVAAALSRRGADATRGFDSLGRDSQIDALLTKNRAVAGLAPVLPPPCPRVPGLRYATILLEKVAFAPSASIVPAEPLIEFAVVDAGGAVIEAVQALPAPCLVRDTFAWWGASLYVQHPVENLPDGARALFTLADRAAADPAAVVAWATLDVGLGHLATGNKGLEMFAAPVDPAFARPVAPHGAFLSLDVHV